MPTVAQTELHPPKSWNEFEDIVWELYARLWHDPNAQRHGRSGQRQQGVDIYGQPEDLGGEYVGIQCKRYEDGNLTRTRIEKEIAKAEQFRPPLAKYIIATTEHLDTDLQVAVREIDAARRAVGKFPVHIVFWEDLCRRLCDEANNDLLLKHYGDWARRWGRRALPLGVPFQAPPLPSHFVPRPEVTDDVKARLLSDDPAAPGVLVVSAIHGLGGIGKSVLAAALAHDPDVQHRFPDGVLWATLGQQPDLLSLLSTWVQALGDRDFHPTTLDAASAHLRTLLHEKAALLVVDDVWDPDHALPFRVGGPRCQVLITTRRADVADELGAHLYRLHVMTPDQALDLLSARLERPLPEDERADARRLARAVGHLPLALELAAAQVARGASWDALREDLEQEVARLEALEGPGRRRRHQLRLEATLNRSLEWLRTEDEEGWHSYVWLGVLPEDAVVFAPMAATLWGIDQAQAADLLALLRDDALLQASSPVLVGEHAWSGYRLHDLLHDLACRLLTAERPQGLGLALPNAHAHLLGRYRTQTQDGLWHTLPDDGYVHAHLAWHMERAGQAEALHALLREETSGSHNGWYEAHERLGQTAGYLADVEVASNLAEEAFTVGDVLEAVGLQCRYALVFASLNSLARNIPPGLLVALVERGMWPPAQGLAYTRQVPDPQQQIQALAGLALHLPQPLKEQALPEALAAARQIEGEDDRARALVRLAPHLPDALLPEALAAARQIEQSYYRVEALAGLAPHLPDALLPEALAAARQIEQGYYRVEALAGLAPHLPDALLSEALAATRQIRREDRRTEALAGLAPHLPDALLPEALAAARQIRREDARAEALVGLLPHLSHALLPEALAAARQIEDEGDRAEALAGLAPRLRQPLKEQALPEALVAARQIRREDARADALAGLAPHLPDALLPEALAAACQIRREDARATALAGLAPHLPHALLSEALAAARQIRQEDAQVEALAGLASHLPHVLLSEALATARQIEGEDDRAEALVRLAPHLSDALLPEALDAARKISYEGDRAEALAGLAPHLPDALLPKALAAARQIRQEDARARALVGLAPHLPQPSKEQALPEALAAACQIAGEYARARALAGLAPHLPDALLPEALTAARQISDSYGRAEALAGLALYLSQPLKEQVLSKALAAARQIEQENTQAWVLAALAPHLPDALLSEALAAVCQIEQRYYRVEALARLAPYLPQPLKEQALPEALAAACRIRREDARARALARLACHLSEALLPEALAAARQIEQGCCRVEALVRLAPHLPQPLKEQALPEALATACLIEDEGARAEALARLAPHLAALPGPIIARFWSEPHDGVPLLRFLARRSRSGLLADLRALAPLLAFLGGKKAIAETFRAIQDVGRWWP